MKNVYVGIDLGTVNSCVAIWNEEKATAEIFETGDGKILPSFVCYDPKSNRIQVGKSGLRDVENYKSAIYDAKRFIGRKFSDPSVQSIYQQYPFTIQGDSNDRIQFRITHKRKQVDKTPEIVSTEILKYIKTCLDLNYEEGIKINAVITIPAYFNNDQRIATRHAAQNAGFTVLRLVKEPTAAAINFFNCNSEAEGLIVVFDLGGGTLDVSVVEKKGSIINVKCSDGDNFLGGRNFEEEILKDLLEDFERNKIKLSDLQKKRLQESIKNIKEKLSTKTKAIKEIEQFFDDNEDFEFKLNRIKFDQLNKFLFEKCIAVIERCLSANNIKKTQVRNVIMVGGSTKIPTIRQMVQDYFDHNPMFHWDDPDLSVALGAAAYAFNLADPNECTMVLPPSITINEICSMNIGKDMTFGLFDLIIERNTPLPIKKILTYRRIRNYQETSSIKWYEGNFKCAAKNHYLGEIVHTNLPKVKYGEIHFERTIEVDLDNILKITSKVKETNQTETLTLSLCENLKNVLMEDGFPGWTQKDDENFERLALIKFSFYSCYSKVALLKNIDCASQDIMFNNLDGMEDQGAIIREINNFVRQYHDESCKYMGLIQKLLKCVESPINILRNLKVNACIR